MKRSLFLVSMEQYISAAILFISTALTARLLQPSDFGVVALGGAALGLVETVRECGVSAFLIQQHELNKEKVRTAFTVMLLTTVVLAAALWLMIGPITAYFGAPALESYLRLTMLGLIFAPFMSPIIALMRRDMDFGRLAVMNIGRSLVTGVTTISSALYGYGYMSMAWAGLASAMFTLALAFNPDFSIFRLSLAEWRPVATFTGYEATSALLNRCWAVLPDFVIARVLGIDAVGLFNRAGMIGQIPDSFLFAGLGPVMLPAFSGTARSGGCLKTTYLNALGFMTAVHWPTFAMLIIFAKPIVLLLLGAKWLDTVPLIQVTAGAMMFGYPAYFTNPVLLSCGAVRDTLSASLISLPLSALVVLLAAPHGLIAVALGMYIIVPLQVIVALWFVRRRVSVSSAEILRAVRKSFVLLVAAVVAALAVLAAFGSMSDPAPATAVCAGAAAVAGWLAAVLLVDHPVRGELLDIAGRLKWRMPVALRRRHA